MWAVCLCLLAIVWWFSPRRLNVPCIPSYPVIGGLYQMMLHWETMPDMVTKFMNEFKTTFGIPLPGVGFLNRGAILMTRPEEVEHVLVTNFEAYEKTHRLGDMAEELLGKGIFAVDGKSWLFHRKVASRMFTRRLMQCGGETMENHVNILIQKIRSLGSNPFDIQDLFFRLTIDVFTQIAFGLNLKSFENEHQHEFARAFDEVQYLVEKRVRRPLWWFDRLFQISSLERRISRSAKIMTEFGNSIINAKRREAKDGTLGPDLISRFLEESESLNETIDNNEIRDIVMNFIIAGRDTTACALSWTIYELLRNPIHIKRIREELATTAEFSYDRLSQSSCLPYMHAVVEEVLRLHPSVPKQGKFAVKRDVWPDGTVVEPGTAVILCSYALNRNPNTWPNPLSFQPERWLESTQPPYVPIKEPPASKFPTFNVGPRICLGKGLAYMEMKLVLSKLLVAFDFKEPGVPHSGEYLSTLVMPMKGGLKVVATPI